MPLRTYEEALELVRQRVTAVEGESVQVVSATPSQAVLSRPVVATRPNPAFDNSAVDGYLLGAPSAVKGERFRVTAEVRAGSEIPSSGPAMYESFRIFTGAPVPAGEFCVLMQEDAQADGSFIEVLEDIGMGAAIRRIGADFTAGTTLVPAGTRLGPAEIALASWNGGGPLHCYREVRIGIAVTGDELAEANSAVEPWQIYDSNGPMLAALAGRVTPCHTSHHRIGDDLQQTENALDAIAEANDLVVVSGGASVGDYDHVPAAVARLGEVFFHGVRVKPGKPVLFGKIRNAFIFGLPGNPASAYVCFELFVREALQRLSGEASPHRMWISARFASESAPYNRDEFIRVRFETRNSELWAEPKFEQGSFGLRSLSAAQGLARLKADTSYSQGDAVECLVLENR